jgi:hypothetical protein
MDIEREADIVEKKGRKEDEQGEPRARNEGKETQSAFTTGQS